MNAAELQPAPEIDEPARSGNAKTSRWADIRWGALAGVVTILGALIPLIFNRRFYFYDDTQTGAFGIWFEIGKKLLQGEWPLFSDAGWGAGNYAAEGQWGLWNPLIMLVGILANGAGNAVVFSTILKIGFLCVLSIGVFALCRNYGANRVWALTSAVAVPLAGFTVYMDSASWVTGLMVFALLPLTWVGLRWIKAGKNPILGLSFGYLLITIGYVHGTIMLVVVFVGLLLEFVITKKWQGIWRFLLAAVILGLVALAVYLPGVLTAPVTARAAAISNSGFLTPDLTGFASSWIGSSLPQISGWWGTFAPVPLLYISWCLPLLALIDFAKLRVVATSMVSLISVGVVSLALALAPSDMGPLRFPVRLTPYVVLCVLVVLAVVLTKTRVEKLSKLRILAILFMTLAGGYLAWAQNPMVRSHVRFLALAVIGILLVLWLIYGAKRRFVWLGRKGILAGTLVVFSLATASAQHYYFQASPLPDFGLPSQVSEYAKPLEKAQGVAFVAGNPANIGPEVWDESLVANSWYMNRTQVQNLYTPLMYAKYAEEFCQDSHGWTCQESADKLFSKDQATGKELVDLLSIDSVQLIRDTSDAGGNAIASRQPPQGWRLAERTDNTVLWVRDQPVLNTGDQVWSSPGTELTTVSNDSGKLVLRVDRVGEDGKAVLSRLDWPGYSVTNAQKASPLRGYLLQLDIPKDSVGKEITVLFEPPGWKLVIGSLLLALLMTLGWAVAAGVLRVRKARRSR